MKSIISIIQTEIYMCTTKKFKISSGSWASWPLGHIVVSSLTMIKSSRPSLW